MKCLKCGKEFEAERASKKFCSDTCRVTYSRKGLSVTEIVPVSVTKPLSVTKEIFTVTPEIEKRLAEIYKAHEKKYSNRFRGSSGNIKVPDVKCSPYYEDGKRVLTEWEKAQLREPIIKEVKEKDHKELVFTNETIEERINAYREEYAGVTYIPNWVLHGFNSKEQAIKEAVKGVHKSVGVNNSGLGI